MGRYKMNISATKVNPQTSFGNAEALNGDFNEATLRDVARITRQLQDTWCPKGEEVSDKDAPKKKSKLGVMISVGGAAVATFLGGKILAKKLFTVFPSLPTKIKNVISKGANFVKEKANELSTKDNKVIEAFGKGLGQVESTARKLYTKFADGKSFEQILTSAVGVASLATIGSDVMTVDGNKDGTSDLVQTKVNAYSNAIKGMGLVEEAVGIMT